MKYNAAIIGFGRRGKTLYGVLNKRRDVLVTAIADPVEMKDCPAQYYSDSEKMFRERKFDFIVIATPPVNHASYIVQCCKLNIPIICEKPLAISEKELQPFVGSVNRIYPAYPLDYDSLIARAFELIKGTRVLRIIASQRVHHKPSGWKSKRSAAGGGTLFDNGSHLVNLAISHFGPPLRVGGNARFVTSEIEYQVDVVLHYPKFDFHIHTDWLSAVGKENTLDIFTEEKDIHFIENNQLKRLYTQVSRTADNWTIDTTANHFIAKGLDRNIQIDPLNQRADFTATELMLETFIADLGKKNSNLSKEKLDIALETIKVINELYQSPGFFGKNHYEV